jgi:hypothetical protein
MADEYNVTMSYNNEIDVTLESATNTQVSTSYVVAESLEDLENLDTSALDKTGLTTNNYVLVYDAVSQTYKFISPDNVLVAAVTDESTPVLPQEFIDQLDVDLDNKIDFDGGGF